MRDGYIWLQPLRIPQGWEVRYNQFYEIDPGPEHMHYFDSPTLLTLHHSSANLLLDMSWRPEHDPQGQFQLRAYPCIQVVDSHTKIAGTETFWDETLLEFFTKDRKVLVEKVEWYLNAFKPYHDPRILKETGETDEPSESFRLKIEEGGLKQDVFEEIVENGNQIIQLMVIDHHEVTPEMLTIMTECAMRSGLRKKATDILRSKRFRKKYGLD